MTTVIRLSFLLYAAAFAAIILITDKAGGSMWSFVHAVPGGDKAGHLGLVGTLSLLANLALRGRRAPRPLSGIMLGTLLVALVMSLEECSQAFFPSRSLDLLDGLANLAGAALGDILARRLLRPKRTGEATA